MLELKVFDVIFEIDALRRHNVFVEWETWSEINIIFFWKFRQMIDFNVTNLVCLKQTIDPKPTTRPPIEKRNKQMYD